MLSIELAPRDVDQLLREAREIADRYPQLTWLNIPDILRLPVRSHDAAIAALGLPLRVIPHIRARDRSIDETLAMIDRLEAAGIRDVLIVTGDRYDENDTGVSSLEVIKAATSRGSGNVRLWAAFDPYRGELRAELDYARAKTEAGATGFFTQPFFDPRYAEICLDQLAHVDTFIGISPVTTEKSRAYWERTNRVVFPSGFKPTLEYCARLTAELIHLAESHGQHAYLMPIRLEPQVYLGAAFAEVNALRTAH